MCGLFSQFAQVGQFSQIGRFGQIAQFLRSFRFSWTETSGYPRPGPSRTIQGVKLANSQSTIVIHPNSVRE